MSNEEEIFARILGFKTLYLLCDHLAEEYPLSKDGIYKVDYS